MRYRGALFSSLAQGINVGQKFRLGKVIWVGKSRFLAAVGPQSITIDHSRGLKRVMVVKKEVSRNSKIKRA